MLTLEGSHFAGPRAGPPRSLTPAKPRWVIPALAALLVGTAILYVYRLGGAGYANSYYAAAAQAGSVSWKAFFFGSLDSGNLITVDKPPLSLWFMALSIRAFGLSSWSLLVPQALMGVGSVALLFATVRRWNGLLAGFLAAAALAVTPIATLMFRYDNPDALLTLLAVLAAYAVTRAVETGGAKWMYAVGALVGLGFLTKMLQVFLIVPAIAAVYLIAASGARWQRVVGLGRAALGLVVVAGSWLGAVVLTPAAHRPWIGSTVDNNIFTLTVGYNGIGRLTGNEKAGAVQVSSGSGSIGRMFNGLMIVDVAWLLGPAMMAAVICLTLCRGRPRTDRERAGVIMWTLWLVVCVVVFSSMSGIFHSYYAVQLAPAIAALFGIGAAMLWHRRRIPSAVVTLMAGTVLTTVSAVVAFAINPGFAPWLMWSLIAAGAVCVIGWGITYAAPRGVRAVGILAAITCLTGPTAFSVATAATNHTGSSVSAGPRGAGRSLFRAGFDCSRLAPLLKVDSGSYRWVAAADRVSLPAACQLATGDPVMAIGGFYGRDPAPTLDEFKSYVRQRQVHYYLGRLESKLPENGPEIDNQIASWVELHFAARQLAGLNVYDLTVPVAATR